MTVTPDVTVVVATRNRREELLTTLHRHEAPVILVDNGSTDGTPAAVRERFPDIQLVELGRNIGAAARTVGIRLATTPYVAFADDDSWWAPGSLRAGVDLIRTHPKVALVNARILVGPEQRLDPICALMADSPLPRRSDLPGVPVLGFISCASIARRSWPSAASMRSFGFPGRRSAWPSTWLRRGGRWSTPTSWWCTTIPPRTGIPRPSEKPPSPGASC